jgi:hypothetical protein
MLTIGRLKQIIGGLPENMPVVLLGYSPWPIQRNDVGIIIEGGLNTASFYIDVGLAAYPGDSLISVFEYQNRREKKEGKKAREEKVILWGVDQAGNGIIMLALPELADSMGPHWKKAEGMSDAIEKIQAARQEREEAQKGQT